MSTISTVFSDFLSINSILCRFFPLLGTWVKSSFVVRSRPFVVSTMGSVTAQHYNISFYACYHKLYLHETHRDTVMQ